MPTITSKSQLEKLLRQRMKTAMDVVAQKAEADMYEATGEFYSGGAPKMYERTGALANTPMVSPVSASGNTASFEAKLDTSGGYTTGDNPTMMQVLNLANSGEAWTTASGNPARPTVGKPGFWEKAKEEIKNDLDETMNQFFG